MYSKECVSSSQCPKSHNVPVESFDAGPSLEEFARRNAAEQTRVVGTQYAVPNQTDNTQETDVQDSSTTSQNALECTGCKGNRQCCSSKKIIGNLEADDLLLLLLIFLMIYDKDANSDFVIPILLAVLLLF